MADATTGGAVAEVKSIFVYPVKSCRGISVSQAPLTCNGRMYTQRVEPKLALIQVELPVEAFSSGWQPNKSSFLDPMLEPAAIANGVSVWEWSGSAFDEGEEAAEWFSRFLAKPGRLVRFNEATECRPANSDYARSYTIKFNDWYPFHLLSQGSLNALNNRLSEPIAANRFRPNFVVDGCEPFSEDLWNEIKINELTFRGGELCYRCKIPTISQETAEAGCEPNEALTHFRSDKVLYPDKEKHRGRVYMGQMLVCTNYMPESGKAITVGDHVYLIKAVSSYQDCIL